MSWSCITALCITIGYSILAWFGLGFGSKYSRFSDFESVRGVGENTYTVKINNKTVFVRVIVDKFGLNRKFTTCKVFFNDVLVAEYDNFGKKTYEKRFGCVKRIELTKVASQVLHQDIVSISEKYSVEEKDWKKSTIE